MDGFWLELLSQMDGFFLQSLNGFKMLQLMFGHRQLEGEGIV
jgi:hypothetical protein